MILKFYKTCAFFVLLSGFCLAVNAQKLPSVQEKSLTAPADLRIDGKNKEWKDGFQASNKRTNVSYTLSNDEENIYLALKSDDVTSNRKILAGGITLAINTAGKRDEERSISLTYPVLDRNAGRGASGQGRNSELNEKQRDSAQAAAQRTQLKQAKEIHIKGFRNTADSVISIYNLYRIKAYASIGDDNTFFYEVAIPFESLGIQKNHTGELAYHIQVNGIQMQGFGGGGGRPGMEDLMSPTDFWGKYTLAIK